MRHLDVPNLRGRTVPNDQAREQERSGDRDTESDVEFDFGSAEEAERGPAEMSGNGQKGSSRRREPKPTIHRRDDAIEGEKTEDELETANSDESENRSEGADSVRMFDSDTLNQPRPKRKRKQQEKRQHRDSRRADKARASRQADRKGRSARNRTGRGERRCMRPKERTRHHEGCVRPSGPRGPRGCSSGRSGNTGGCGGHRSKEHQHGGRGRKVPFRKGTRRWNETRRMQYGR